MDWNTLFLWIAGPSCVATLITALRQSPRLRGWIFVCSAILASGAIAYQQVPDIAGYVSGGLWAVFVLGPALLQRNAGRWSNRQQYKKAARYAQLAGILHPFDGVPEQTQFLKALSLAEAGESEAALVIMTRLEKTAPARTARLAAVHARRLSDDWPELLMWLQANINQDRLLKEPSLLPMCIRALGETGRLSPMLQMAWASRLSLHPAVAAQRSMSRMMVFAFCGARDMVAEVFTAALRQIPVGVQQFWLATADYAMGDLQSAERRFLSMEPAATADLRLAIQRRRANPPLLAEMILTPADRAVLEQLKLQQEHELRFSPTIIHARRPWMTYGLILANVIVFAVEWAMGARTGHWVDGGTMTDQVLRRLGAMQPDVLQTGEYYRLFMANFLHYGYPHILMNMLALWILGPFVEFSLGRWVYLFFYLGTGVCVMVTVLFFQQRGWMEPEMLVGASGAIMAIIGATAAILLRGWYREKATAALRRLGGVGSMLLLQVTFDHFTPQVSGAAHLAGMAWGFVIASLIPHRKALRQATGLG